MAKPAFPDILKKANWDKQKGIVAKLAKGETGIGEGLDGVLAAYNAVPWEKVDEATAMKSHDPAAVKKAFEEGKAVLNGQVEAARKKSFEMSRLASKVAEDFKKNTLIPKSSREYLAKMSEGASHFATSMRDSAIEGLKKMEQIVKEMTEHLEEVKTLGENYVQTRKQALVQMQSLQRLFLEGKTRMTQAVTTADELAKHAVANPTAAAVDVPKIEEIHHNVQAILENAKKNYGTVGDVAKNPVQGTARGDLKPYPVASLQPILKKYHTDSAPLFKGIMDCVAAILTMEKEMETQIGSVETSLDIAKEAASAGTKSLAQYQEYARATSKASIEALAAMTDNNKKLGTSVARYPTLISAMKDPKNDAQYKKGVIMTSESTITEIKRRTAVLEQAVGKQDNIERKLKALPAQIQNDPIVKAEMAKIAGVVRNAKALVVQAHEALKKAEAGDSTLKKLQGA